MNGDAIMASKEKVAELATRRASDVLRDSDRDSVGLVRVLSGNGAGDVREYQEGDEALVDAGRAEWVVAPVHAPSAGRRLDTDAEREALPRDGIEAFPPVDGDPLREAKARRDGYVQAHSADGLAEKLAGARAKVAREAARSEDDGDAKTQAALGGLGARSGPVTHPGDLGPADLVDDDTALTAAPDQGGSQPAKSTTRAAKASGSKES